MSHFLYHAAAYLILRENGKVLLIRRYNTGWMDGQYSLPAGHIEEGETVEEAMVREAKEEIGITVRPQDLSVVHVMQRKTADRTYIDFCLTTDKWVGTPFNNEPTKCDDVSWYPIDALPENTLEYVALALKNSSDQKPFSTYGF